MRNPRKWINVPFKKGATFKLVGGFNPSGKYKSNWIISSGRVEHKKPLKPPASKGRIVTFQSHDFSRFSQPNPNETKSASERQRIFVFFASIFSGANFVWFHGVRNFFHPLKIPTKNSTTPKLFLYNQPTKKGGENSSWWKTTSTSNVL